MLFLEFTFLMLFHYKFDYLASSHIIFKISVARSFVRFVSEFLRKDSDIFSNSCFFSIEILTAGGNANRPVSV